MRPHSLGDPTARWARDTARSTYPSARATIASACSPSPPPGRSPSARRLDGPLGDGASPLHLAGQHHQDGAHRGQRLAFGLGRGRRRLFEMLDRLGIAPAHDNTLARPRGTTRSTVAPQLPSKSRATASASRTRPVTHGLDELGGDHVLQRITRAAISRARSSRRTAVAGARGVTARAARRNRSTAWPSPGSAPSPRESRPGQRARRRHRARGRPPVQSLAHGQREIVIDGVADEVVTEAQTIAGFGEQP